MRNNTHKQTINRVSLMRGFSIVRQSITCSTSARPMIPPTAGPAPASGQLCLVNKEPICKLREIRQLENWLGTRKHFVWTWKMFLTLFIRGLHACLQEYTLKYQKNNHVWNLTSQNHKIPAILDPPAAIRFPKHLKYMWTAMKDKGNVGDTWDVDLKQTCHEIQTRKKNVNVI